MDKNKKIQQQDELKALDIIKKNLINEKFKSHKQVEEFLADKQIYLSQASISRLFNTNCIKKNNDGYYEDFIKKNRKLALINFFSQHDCKIYKPMIYGNYVSNDGQIDSKGIGYYEDFIKKNRKLALINFFSQHDCKIYKPMIYGNYVSNDGQIDSKGIYTLLINVDNGYENYLYELISDFWGKSNLMCITGHNYIQILNPNLANIYKIYRILIKIKKANS